MKVTASCFGRFHILDQARELERLGVLHRLICAFPKNLARQWSVPTSKVTTLLANGFAGRIATLTGPNLPLPVAQELTRWVHDSYSRRSARHIPAESDVFIGLSSFCREGLVRAKQQGMVAVVDHGSLHERTERELLEQEIEIWGLRTEIRWPPPWLMDKEDEEFGEADSVFVLSRAAKESLVGRGVPESKVFVNNCGVDISAFNPGKKADSVFRIIQCGSIIPRKGVQYLLRAFSELRLPNSELWFIGGGVARSPLKPVIQRYVAPNVVFKGTCPRHELRRLYAQGSVFVLASVADGFGMVVPQAMACGLPVIVTNNVGAADVVTDGKNGFVVPARDVDALKQRLLYLYENAEARDRLAGAALEISRRELSWEHYGERLVSELVRRLGARVGAHGR